MRTTALAALLAVSLAACSTTGREPTKWEPPAPVAREAERGQSAASARAAPPLTDVAGADAWFQRYYTAPEPERIEEYVRFVDSSGLASRPGTQVALGAFLGEVVRANPDRVDAWTSSLASCGDDGLRLMAAALWYAQVPDLESRLRTLAGADADEEQIARLTGVAPPDAARMPLDEPYAIDHLWGRFMASGDALYVRRVISALPPTDDDGEVEGGLTPVSAAARWSLAGIARNHPRVLEICRAEAPSQPPGIARTLSAVIDVATRPAER